MVVLIPLSCKLLSHPMMMMNNVKHWLLCVGHCDKWSLWVSCVFSMLDCDNYDGCHLYPPHIYPFMYFNCTVTWLFIYSKMFNSINKYFTRLTPNQIELRELLDRQASRAALQAREARETVVQETTSEVINLIDNDEEIAVTNSLQDAFQRIIDSGELPTVVSSTVESYLQLFNIIKCSSPLWSFYNDAAIISPSL